MRRQFRLLPVRRTILAIGVAALVGACDTTRRAAAQPVGEGAAGHLRIVTWNVAKLNSENDENRNCVPGSISAVFAALNDDDVPGFAVAPHVFVFQEVPPGEQNDLHALITAEAPSGVSYTVGTYTNNSETTGAQALIYRSDTLTEITSEHTDISTGAGREADRWKLQLRATRR